MNITIGCPECGHRSQIPEIEARTEFWCERCEGAAMTPVRRRNGSDELDVVALRYRSQQRHVIVSIWLLLMLIGSFGGMVLNLGSAQEICRALPLMPVWGPFVLAGLGFVNFVCVLAMFNWQKWGFYGICVTSVLTLMINWTAGLGAGAIGGLFGVVILFVILQIGSPRSAWSELR
jgi:hypothetical protein